MVFPTKYLEKIERVLRVTFSCILLKVFVLKEIHDLNCDEVEMLWIEVFIPNCKLLVCVVYRPPGTTASFWDNFDYSLEQALHFTES
jgi:hypothetical protein